MHLAEQNTNGRVGYLQYLCNKYGDFRVAIAQRDKQGNIIWSKHRSVLDCWQSEEGLAFLERVNNRTCTPCEIFLDLDQNISENTLNWICDTLEDYGFSYKAYFTGSKGFHIHVMIPELTNFPRFYREKIRAFLINKLKCDGLKKSEGHMVAVENCPHWKTGNTKTLVRTSK